MIVLWATFVLAALLVLGVGILGWVAFHDITRTEEDRERNRDLLLGGYAFMRDRAEERRRLREARAMAQNVASYRVE